MKEGFDGRISKFNWFTHKEQTLGVTSSFKRSYLETEEELEMRPGITERRVGGGWVMRPGMWLADEASA